MNKYFPSRRELDFLSIGVLIGTIVSFWFNSLAKDPAALLKDEKTNL